ncbi:MAG: hypothetical protein JO356_19175 [Acidobacteria bacterium]|nr:hypothetical protein [Acidobacteriota bacterium]
MRLIRMMAVKLGLIPASMKQKQWLKRVFYGKLERIPIEITRGMTATEPLIPLQTQSNADGYRFIFAIASRLGPQG